MRPSAQSLRKSALATPISLAASETLTQCLLKISTTTSGSRSATLSGTLEQHGSCSRSCLTRILLELVDGGLALDNEAALETQLKIGPPVEHPARPRIKARRCVGFEALQTVRR
jgi:hypothetical protein